MKLSDKHELCSSSLTNRVQIYGHFSPFRARKNAFLCLHLRYRVLTTSALGGAKVDMSAIHANYRRLSPGRRMILGPPRAAEHQENRLRVPRSGVGARCRQFFFFFLINILTCQERRHSAVFGVQPCGGTALPHAVKMSGTHYGFNVKNVCG